MASRRARRRTVLACSVTAAVLACSSSALADSAAITVTTDGGAPDPAAFLPRTFTVTGTGPAGRLLFMKHHPAGGPACGRSPYADSGALWTGFYGLPVNGPFSFAHVVTWDAIGTWIFCFWLTPDERTDATPIAQAVTFRLPSGSLSAATTPAVPRPGQRATLSVTGWSEAPRLVFAKLRAAGGAPCAPTYAADPGEKLIDGESANGAFAGQRVVSEKFPGSYLVCTWLAGSDSDPTPVVAQPFTFAVVQPTPVVSSVKALNCASRKVARRFRARKTASICMRYRFGLVPYPGQRLSLTYRTPKGRTYKTVTWRWPDYDTRQVISAALPRRAYKHRHGRWRAVLRVDGKPVKTASFRVI